ncbi:MAG: hypothetical protein ACXVHQ_36120 [Solirubrobacteraceae bacterium]
MSALVLMQRLISAVHAWCSLRNIDRGERPRAAVEPSRASPPGASEFKRRRGQFCW